MAKKPQITETKNTDQSQPPEPKDQDKITEEELAKQYQKDCETYFAELNKIVETNKARAAIAIVIDDKIPTIPLLYRHGNTYELAQVVSQLLKSLKKQLMAEL